MNLRCKRRFSMSPGLKPSGIEIIKDSRKKWVILLLSLIEMFHIVLKICFYITGILLIMVSSYDIPILNTF